MTRVINMKDAPFGWQNNPDFVYIGRQGKGFDGYFGNPIQIKVGEKRGTTLKKYEEYLKNRLLTDRIFLKKTQLLKGKTLVCFCKPKPCHGDILAEYAERLWLNNIK